MKISFVICMIMMCGFLVAGNWEFITPIGRITEISQLDSLYWICTNGGLFKLDTATGQIDHYTESNSTLPTRYIKGIARGWDGRIWVGTTGGVAILNGGKWETWEAQEIVKGVKNGSANDLVADGLGRVWIAMDNPGNVSTDSQILILTIAPTGIKTTGYDAMVEFVASHGGYVIAHASSNIDDNPEPHGEFILIFDGNRMRRAQIDDWGGWNLALGADGSLFDIVYSDDGYQLTMWDGISEEVMYPVTRNLASISASTFSLGQKMTSRLLVIMDGHVYEYSSSALKKIFVPEEFAGKIDSVYDMPDGQIIATAGTQVLQIGKDYWHSFNINPTTISPVKNVEGYRGQMIYDIAVDSSGKAWFASKTELSSFDGTNWQRFVYPFLYSPTDMGTVSLEIDSEDNILVGYKDNIYVLIGDALTAFCTVTGLKELVVDGLGRLWVLSEDNLQVYDKGAWRQYDNELSGFPGNGLENLHADSNNQLWTYHGNTAYSFDGETWVRYPYKKIGYLSGSGDTFVDSRGRLWTGEARDGKLTCYLNQVKASFYPIAFDWCTDFSAGPDGTWWAWGTREGMYSEVEAIHFNGELIATIPGSPIAAYRFISYVDKHNNKWFVYQYSDFCDLEIGIYNENGVRLGN